MSLSNRKTILIVDDTPTNIGIISSVLKDSFRTKVATNGEKALVLASADDRPDLILLDITMPGMDGYEVCRRLKANPATRGIPVIFLTAKTEAEDEEQGFEVGAVDYIHKPFSAPIVLARVNTHIALQAALQQARDSQRQADELLHCLLPEAAAEEIRSIGTVIPRRYNDVAVLFCDVVNFTSYCDKHEPEDVVSRLDALFVAFERVAAAHGLEKIKTIGDAFMAAAGLLKKANDPLESAVLCGLQMAATSIDAQLGWAVRVGVHIGPVVAGIVGQERYQFDIWGDTVNIAARMAGKAMPGGVAVTDETWRQIKDRFEGESLGDLEVKGKGTISVVAVQGKQAISK
ncbi:MAG: adenylate/guanylate cyclase domain-containing protein [Bradyrhizobium sp.]